MTALPSPSQDSGKLYIVGIGPGSPQHMTLRAAEVIEQAEVVIGNSIYMDQVSHLLKGQMVIRSRMGQEVDRAKKAVSLAKNKIVAIISGGDSNIYGMAGLILEVARNTGFSIDIEIVPGITALSAVASLLGAPVVSDFAVVSLSDLLTPWDMIEKRLEAVAGADMVIGLYNPKSRQRNENFRRAVQIIKRHRPESVPVGIVTNALRGEGQTVMVTTLKEILDFDDAVDMRTTVIIGNSESTIWDSISGPKIITPRGYHTKYDY